MQPDLTRRLTMRAMSIAAIAIALIATAPVSAAADQTITESFTVTIPNSVVPGGDQPFAQFVGTPFPMFAPSTGTLKSVGVTLTGAVSVASLVANPDIGIILQNGDDIIDGTPEFGSGTTNINLSGTDKTSSYIGTGEIQLLLLMGSGSSPENASLIESVGALNGVVTYDYTLPTLAIPETPTWATMLVGFASLGFAGYRATRKAAVRA
jgi:hypothetical protein